MSYFPLTNTGGVTRNPEVDYENAILENFGMRPGKTADEDLAGADVVDGHIGMAGIDTHQLQYEPVAPEIIERVVGVSMPRGFRA